MLAMCVFVSHEACKASNTSSKRGHCSEQIISRRLTSLESKQAIRPQTTHSETRRGPQRGFSGPLAAGGCERPPNTKAACRLPRARTPADATAADAAPAGRLDSGNRRPAGLPAGSSTRTNKQPKKTLAAKQNGDRIKTPREPVPRDARTEKIRRRDPLRRTCNKPLVPRE